MNFKYIFITLILLCSLFFFTGCYDAINVETLAYAVAIGIDKIDNESIRLTVQIASPSGSSDSSSSSQSTASTVLDVKCSTVDDGISLINSYISKTLNLSHCKAVVISEELAYTGLSKYVYGLINNVQLRPDCYIIISRCDAYYFLRNSAPTLESVSARYYELISNSSEHTSYTDAVRFATFYEDMLSSTTQPTAILGGVNTKETQEAASNSESLDSGFKADETPLQTSNNIENMGIAVFVDDTLVGELNSIETLCHMIISNKLKNATINVPNPYDDKNNISIYISLNKDTKKTVKIINDYPYITCNISIKGSVLNLDDTIDLTDQEAVQKLNDSATAYLEYCVLSYLYKTAKDFHSDIDGFGNYLICKYPSTKEWETSDWLNNYENSFFNITVDFNVTSAQLFDNY